eukprot:15463158-Alexandrium_andersonii.AAC.1
MIAATSRPETPGSPLWHPRGTAAVTPRPWAAPRSLLDWPTRTSPSTPAQSSAGPAPGASGPLPRARAVGTTEGPALAAALLAGGNVAR